MLRDTDVRLADAWFDYVPRHSNQAHALMTEARSQQAGALHRVRHIIHQIDERAGLMSVPGLAAIKNGWRNDMKSKRREPERADSRDRGEGRTDPPSKARKLAQPTHFDSVDRWAEYYREFPNSIPRQLRSHPEDTTVPSPLLIEGNSLLRRFIPSTRSRESAIRAALLSTLVRLFSVSSLYERLVKRLGLRISTTEDIRPFTQMANVSLEDVARWAAECGVTTRTASLLELVARRYRNFELGRPVDAQVAWPDYPSSLADFPLPEEQTLPPAGATDPSQIPLPADDVPMGDADGAPASQPSGHAEDGGIQSTAGTPSGSNASS